MSEHVSSQLSAYLDDELPPGERAAVDAHLSVCAACAAELGELRQVVAYAATVPRHDAPPPPRVWNGIRARIGGARVTSFPAPAAAPGPRRISFSIAQLAAAAALVMAVSAAATWLLQRQAASTAAPTAAGAGLELIEAEVEPRAPLADARLVNLADAQYDAAVSDLERALAERRNDLNPRTVEILERNLKLIDAAIAQARQALEEDPGNTYLNRHLVDSRQRKLDLLRRAASITEGD